METETMEPRAYDLSKNSEIIRLISDILEYLKTCRSEHQGTDLKYLEELLQKAKEK
jgi:hypothetical protein